MRIAQKQLRQIIRVMLESTDLDSEVIDPLDMPTREDREDRIAKYTEILNNLYADKEAMRRLRSNVLSYFRNKHPSSIDFVLPQDIDEVFQDVYIRIFNKINSEEGLAPGREMSPDDFKAYVRGSVIKGAFSYARRRISQKTSPLQFGDVSQEKAAKFGMAAVPRDPFDVVLLDQMEKNFERAIRKSVRSSGGADELRDLLTWFDGLQELDPKDAGKVSYQRMSKEYLKKYKGVDWDAEMNSALEDPDLLSRKQKVKKLDDMLFDTGEMIRKRVARGQQDMRKYAGIS